MIDCTIMLQILIILVSLLTTSGNKTMPIQNLESIEQYDRRLQYYDVGTSAQAVRVCNPVDTSNCYYYTFNNVPYVGLWADNYNYPGLAPCNQWITFFTSYDNPNSNSIQVDIRRIVDDHSYLYLNGVQLSNIQDWRNEMLTSAVMIPPGKSIISMNCVNYDPSGSGPAAIWFLMTDASGKVLISNLNAWYYYFTVPTSFPTINPSARPTKFPSSRPSSLPTLIPSLVPTSIPTFEPTNYPTCVATIKPTLLPTIQPTSKPTRLPSNNPTLIVSKSPSSIPSVDPTILVTNIPTTFPTSIQSSEPSFLPSSEPSLAPSSLPSSEPSVNAPSNQPSYQSTFIPSSKSTTEPSKSPSFRASHIPTKRSTINPTASTSIVPSQESTFSPTFVVTDFPSYLPSYDPIVDPTQSPTCDPSLFPSQQFTILPTEASSVFPTFTKSLKPSVYPSSKTPTKYPSQSPTFKLSSIPSSLPTATISIYPSFLPTYSISLNPTVVPTSDYSSFPSVVSSYFPSSTPSEIPSSFTSLPPSNEPSSNPSFEPTLLPTLQPTVSPTNKQYFYLNADLIESIFIPSTSHSCPNNSFPFIPSKYPTAFPTTLHNPTTLPYKMLSQATLSSNATFYGMNYISSALSSDGQYMYVIVVRKGLYRSTNYGKAWMPLFLNMISLLDVDCDKTGQYVSVVGYSDKTNLFLQLSSNYGLQFTKYVMSLSLSSLPTSMSVAQNAIGYSNLIIGGIQGNIYQFKQPSLSHFFNEGQYSLAYIDIASDHINGTYISAIALNGRIIVSSNGLQSSTIQTLEGINLVNIEMSYDGKIQITCGDNSYIYLSMNYGEVFIRSGFVAHWTAVTSNLDGSILLGSVYMSNIYVSRDIGQTWSIVSSLPTLMNWIDIKTSESGDYVMALANGRNIYYSNLHI